MTRGEALKQLGELKFALSGTDEQFLDIVALDMAMKALETEQQILDAISKHNGSFWYLIDGKMILSKEVFIG